MSDARKVGRVTIPTDLDVVPETLEIMKRWGADAIRDCDGTDFPAELQGQNAKIYSTYYTTRKDNAWAKANPDEVQQCYIMTGFYTAAGEALEIPLMKGISPELMQVNTRDDIKRWWEVMDRTTGTPIAPESWDYNKGTGCVVIQKPQAFHEYTVAVSRGIFPSCRFYLVLVLSATWWIPPLRLRCGRNDMMGGRFCFSSVTVPSFRVRNGT